MFLIPGAILGQIVGNVGANKGLGLARG